MRGLGPNGLAGAEGDSEIGFGDEHGLIQARAQVHFDAALLGVPARLVLEVAQLEIAAELAIDAAEQVEIERAGDAGGIVVGDQHAVRFLDQVGADEQQCRREAWQRRRSRRNSSAHLRSKLPMVLPRNITRNDSPG